MVLMHRKDIIERYGFDPAENSSVVPKGGPTAAINVVPDEEKIEPPHGETPSANPWSNILAGPFKDILTGPTGIYALGASAAWWLKEKASGNKDAEFMEGLYQEGAKDKIQNHLQGHREDLRYQHPDWSELALSDEVQRYAMSPEFFEFNTSLMTPVMRNTMRMAYHINEKAGVQNPDGTAKLPSQETFMDETAQTLGGLALTMGIGSFFKLGATAQKIASKFTQKQAAQTAARYAGNIADFAFVPGIAKPTVGHVAGNVAGGMTVDELQRQVMGDPTVLPSGEALNEMFVKEHERLPASLPRLPTAAAVATPQEEIEKPTPDTLKPTEAGIAGALLGAGAVAGTGLALRGAFRGRLQYEPPLRPDQINTPSEAKEAWRAREGWNPEVDPNLVARATKYLDEKGDVDAPAFQLGREMGIEEQIQAEIGQYLGPHGQQLTLKNIWEDGILPESGEYLGPAKRNFDVFGAADPTLVETVKEALKGMNILSEVHKGREWAENELRVARNAVNATQNSPETLHRYREAQRLHRLWQDYGQAIRRYDTKFPNKDEDYWKNKINEALSTPEGVALLDNYKDIAYKINSLLYEGRIITHAEFMRRNREEPYHVALYQYDKKTGIRYDPTEPRHERYRRIDQPIPEIDSPIATAKQSLEIAARAASNMIGRRNAIEAFAALDPDGREIRVVTPEEWEGIKGHAHKVEFNDRSGNRMVAAFNRKAVADSLNQAPLDGGIAWNIANAIRLTAQQGMVGLAAATAQAPVSLMYNIGTGIVGQRAGTSIGYLSNLIRGYNRTGNPTIEKAADVVDLLETATIISPLTVYGFTAVEAATYRLAREIGAKAATQAISKDGLFGIIARSVPNGEQVIANLGARLEAFWTNSWFKHYQRWVESGAHPTVFERDLWADQIKNNLREYANGSPRGMRESLRPIFDAYLGILSHIASLHQMTQVAQAVGVQEARLGRPLSFRESRQIGERARISAGNMSAQPGSKVLRGTAAIAPFFRIGVASTRYLFHALTSRGAWDSSLVAMRMGGVAGAVYMANKMMEDLELTDWWYEKLNDFERMGVVPMLKFQHWVSLIQGEKPNINRENPKDDFWMVPLPQELAAYYGTMMYGLEQLGSLNRGSNRGNTSAEKDLLFNVLRTLGIGQMPIVNAITIPTLGKKLDVSSLIRGKAALTDVQGSRAQLGDMPSGIPSVVAEEVKTLFGFMGDMVIRSLDAGIQDYNKTKSYLSATSRGWEEAVGVWKDKQPMGLGMWDAGQKHYSFGAMSQETARIKKAAEALEVAYQNNFTPAGAKRGSERKVVADPEVKRILAMTHYFFQRGGIPKIQDRINLINNKIDNNKSSKGTLSYDEVKQRELMYIKEMYPWHVRQADVIKRYERLLTDRYGHRFKAEGLEPNVDGVTALVKRYSQ